MRPLRPYVPGGVFHITARLNNKEHWLEPAEVREFALKAMIESLKRTDANLIAYAIMTNHLHVVARQGARPMSQLMQPLLRRIALRIQKHYKRTGHVFGGPYWAEVCSDPAYLRRLILYCNLNPQHARMCGWDDDYAWSSHSAYMASDCIRSTVRRDVETRLAMVLGVFASAPGRTIDELHEDYRAHVERAKTEFESEVPSPLRLCTDDGDEYWSGEFAHRTQDYGEVPRPALSVQEVAAEELKKNCPGMDIDWLRVMRGGREVVAVRKKIIERCLRLGHRPKGIASFLHIGESTVSKVRSNMVEMTFVRHAPFPKINV